MISRKHCRTGGGSFCSSLFKVRGVAETHPPQQQDLGGGYRL